MEFLGGDPLGCGASRQIDGNAIEITLKRTSLRAFGEESRLGAAVRASLDGAL